MIHTDTDQVNYKIILTLHVHDSELCIGDRHSWQQLSWGTEVCYKCPIARTNSQSLFTPGLLIFQTFARKIAIYMASRAKIGFSMKRTNSSKANYIVFKTLLKCSFLTSASFQLVVWRIGSSWDYLSNHSLCDGQKLVPTLTSDFILSLSSSVFFHSSLYFRICILSP